MDTREKILETAVRLFSSHGYADTSLAQVARAACVSKALVLWYFESKERLFRAALQHFLTPYEIDDHALRRFQNLFALAHMNTVKKISHGVNAQQAGIRVVTMHS